MRFTVIAAGAASLVACTVGNDTTTNNTSTEGARVGEWVVREEPPPEGPPPAEPQANAEVSACLMQGKEQLKVAPIKAVGTEPFWGAKIEGRCVTYSTPENQAGSRIWTKYETVPDGRVWIGTFQNKPFKLILRAKPDCSDGMSDRIYPMEALLTVAGEERRGCAAPE